jgi:hypothetical protein
MRSGGYTKLISLAGSLPALKARFIVAQSDAQIG